MKTLWPMVKLLTMSNFPFRHNVFNFFHQLYLYLKRLPMILPIYFQRCLLQICRMRERTLYSKWLFESIFGNRRNNISRASFACKHGKYCKNYHFLSSCTHILKHLFLQQTTFENIVAFIRAEFPLMPQCFQLYLIIMYPFKWVIFLSRCFRSRLL